MSTKTAPKFNARTLTPDQAAEIAEHAGGWSVLAEKAADYGAAGKAAALGYGIAMKLIAPPREKQCLGAPAAVASYLALRYGVNDQEVMGALYLDTRNRLIKEMELYRGTVNRAAVEPRLILKNGLLCGAVGMILFHTHPSGDPAPSPEDLAFTRRVAEGGELVGVRLTDHLIIGSVGRWVSLRERGAW